MVFQCFKHTFGKKLSFVANSLRKILWIPALIMKQTNRIGNQQRVGSNLVERFLVLTVLWSMTNLLIATRDLKSHREITRLLLFCNNISRDLKVMPCLVTLRAFKNINTAIAFGGQLQCLGSQKLIAWFTNMFALTAWPFKGVGSSN